MANYRPRRRRAGSSSSEKLARGLGWFSVSIGIAQILAPRLVTAPDVVVCNSRFTQGQTARWLPRVPAHVAYCPVSAPGPPERGARRALRDQLGVDDDRPVIAMSARAEAWKGHRVLIEACADRLLLVADGRVTPFDGDLEDYQRMILSKTAEPERAAARDSQSSKATQRREAAGKRQALKPLKQAMDRSEREVTALHGEIETIDAQLAASGLFDKDPAKGEALSKKRAETVRALTAAEARWIEAAERYEAALND